MRSPQGPVGLAPFDSVGPLRGSDSFTECTKYDPIQGLCVHRLLTAARAASISEVTICSIRARSPLSPN